MLDSLLDRVWKKGYTCNEFAIDAYKLITGVNIQSKLMAQLNGGDEFIELEYAKTPCIVFMSNSNKESSHIGIFYNEKILHLTTRGVQFAPLELIEIYFKNVSFYAPTCDS